MRYQFRKPVPLSQVEGGRLNNLNLIRFVAASAVVLGHSYSFYVDAWDLEPMKRYLHFNANLGDIAVFSFFFISGFLVFKSALRQSDPARFLRARALRILPGLAAVVLLLTFVLGPLLTQLSLPDYFRNGRTWHYLLTAVLNHGAGLALPGVFEHRRISEVDLPLWTLSSEWFMYMCALLAAMVIAGKEVRSRISLRSWLVLGLALLMTLQTFPLPMKYSYKWILCFICGSLVYRCRNYIGLSIPIAFSCFALDLFLVRFAPLVGKPLFPLALFYFLLVVGFHPALLNRGFLRLGDFSYGIYIFGWPIQQIYSTHTHSPVQLFFWSYLTVLPVAVVSWYCIEEPCLALKERKKQLAEEPALA